MQGATHYGGDYERSAEGEGRKARAGHARTAVRSSWISPLYSSSTRLASALIAFGPSVGSSEVPESEWQHQCARTRAALIIKKNEIVRGTVDRHHYSCPHDRIIYRPNRRAFRRPWTSTLLRVHLVRYDTLAQLRQPSVSPIQSSCAASKV